MNPVPSNILLTGKPGVGKTTLVQDLCRRLEKHNPAGFYTAEVRHSGKRQGFELVSLEARRMVLAHTSLAGEAEVGKYKVDVSGLEDFLRELRLDDPQTALVVIDEIGKMECLSGLFIRQVREVLDSPRPLLATVAQKGGGFIREVKQRPDVHLVEITPENRDRLPRELHRDLSSLLESVS